MGNESPEVQLARLDERFSHILRELEDAKNARKSQYEKMEEQSVALANLDNRMKSVEDSLKQQAPTIEEFITIKHKVVGAGLAGRWLWIALAGLVGIACSMRTEIFRWLTRS